MFVGEGGGVDWQGDVITITGNTIAGNWASAVSGVGYGGGLGLWGRLATVTDNVIKPAG